jgi:hypothetical protein
MPGRHFSASRWVGGQPRSGFGSIMGAGAGGGGSSFVVLHAESPSTIAMATSAKTDRLVMFMGCVLPVQ